jgi:hypothetical protein
MPKLIVSRAIEQEELCVEGAVFRLRLVRQDLGHELLVEGAPRDSRGRAASRVSVLRQVVLAAVAPARVPWGKAVHVRQRVQLEEARSTPRRKASGHKRFRELTRHLDAEHEGVRAPWPLAASRVPRAQDCLPSAETLANARAAGPVPHL